jgi:hypothetical protein
MNDAWYGERVGKQIPYITFAATSRFITMCSATQTHPRSDAGEFTQLSEPGIGTLSSAKNDRRVRSWILRHDCFDVRMHDAVHRSVKSLARFYSPLE